MAWRPAVAPPPGAPPMMMFTQPTGRTAPPVVGAAKDPLFSGVKLLLHGDGSSGSTTFTDSSSSARIITAFGDAQISTVQKKFGTSSLSFTTTGYATTPAHADFQPGSANFTLESWVYQTNALTGGAQFGGLWYQNIAGNNQIGTASNASFNLTLASGKPALSVYQGGVDKTITASSAIPLNTWTHIAAARCGGTLFMWVNGVPIASLGFSGAAAASTRVFAIGGDATGSGRFAGFIDDLRYTLGYGRYCSYVAPTEAYPNQ